ncbi:MAG: FG-GAP-like repeat-containing protein [bacterium]
MKKIILAVLSIMLFSVVLFANNLSEISTFYSGAYPRGLVAADVNGDGIKEIVVANFGGATLIGQDVTVTANASISIFSKDGSSLKKIDLPSGKSPRGVAAGDFNNDGKEEYAVSSYDDGTVTLYTGVVPVVLNAGKHPVGVSIGDVNKDGFNDIAVAVYSENKIVLFLASGKGTYTRYEVVVSGAPTDVTIGEINGKKVIVSANYNTATISIIDFNGTALIKENDVAVGKGPCKVKIGDVTGDGINDIITANFYDNTVSVVPSGTGKATSYALGGSRPNGLTIADVNGDKLLDVITANRDDDTVDILLQKNGVLVLIKTIKVTNDNVKTYGPVEVVAGDFNGDGLTDIAFTHMRTNTLKVIYQQLPQAPQVMSSSHPNQDTWYGETTASFTLSAEDLNGVAGYLYTISKEQNVFSVKTAIFSAVAAIEIPSLETGTYYFTAATKDTVGNISSALTTYKINITETLSEKNVYNFPNPCSVSTTLRFAMSKAEDVKITISDPNGNLVWHKELPTTAVVLGVNYIIWNLTNDNGVRIANGVYNFKVITADKAINKKIAVVK